MIFRQFGNDNKKRTDIVRVKYLPVKIFVLLLSRLKIKIGSITNFDRLIYEYFSFKLR